MTRSLPAAGRGLCIAAVCLLLGAADQPVVEPRAALQRLNGLIGEWRGVGQPRRQSNKDAWNETAGWVWDLQGAQPAVVQTIAKGRLLTAVRCEYDPAAAEYVVTTTSAAGAARTYRGGWQAEQLVLTSPGDDQSPSLRMTITPRSDIRLVVLHEATEPGKELFYRVAEVGYTRAGRRLAGSGGGQPQCIVTGGLGEIPVQHQGTTYYVCCSGCKQAFEADPERILREYRERLAREREAPAPP